MYLEYIINAMFVDVWKFVVQQLDNWLRAWLGLRARVSHATVG